MCLNIELQFSPHPDEDKVHSDELPFWSALSLCKPTAAPGWLIPDNHAGVEDRCCFGTQGAFMRLVGAN